MYLKKTWWKFVLVFLVGLLMGLSSFFIAATRQDQSEFEVFISDKTQFSYLPSLQETFDIIKKDLASSKQIIKKPFIGYKNTEESPYILAWAILETINTEKPNRVDKRFIAKAIKEDFAESPQLFLKKPEYFAIYYPERYLWFLDNVR